MGKRGKKYTDARKIVDNAKMYPLDEAIELALKMRYAKFNESVDIAMKLGVDPRHADQMVRGTVILPNGTGKVVRVVVFAKGDKEKEALDAGADFAGGDELVERIKEGWLDFERTVATPDMMGTVGKIGRILGPRGLMPNAKLGTVTFDVGRVVREIKSGKVDFKVDKAGVVQALVGRGSFEPAFLRENIIAFVDKIMQLKPSSSKGVYVRSIGVSTTMGPGIKLDPVELRTLAKHA